MASSKVSKRSIILVLSSSVLLIIIFSACFGGDLYDTFENWLGAKAAQGNSLREIGTNKDLWLNGYLGIFFRFKMFGILNWTAIPLFIYFVVTIRKRTRSEIALALALTLSCIFICMQGYSNFRYQLTLSPALITIIFIFGCQVLREQNRNTVITLLSICGCFLLICSFLLLINFHSLRNGYAYYVRGNVVEKLLRDRFPYKLFDYIDNNMANDAVILARNEPILYYHASQKMLIHKGGSKYILARRDSMPGAVLVCEDKEYKLYKVKK